jgi:NTE family protein
MRNPCSYTRVTLTRRVLIITVLCITVIARNSMAQDNPKIGLVLSGGGAKGLAHIGILKFLEEAGITPDFITGTSMGSIIGGLYATGYSAEEIKQIAISADWDQLLTNKVLLDEVAYEEKEYYNRYLNELTISGLNLELPKGLVEGQKLSNLLSNLTRHVHDINDFSQLPIPYACIAADIETGLKVVLDKGSLARSIRASMAIPTMFTPVEIDGKLLVDGGLVHNFPVEENLEMGADFIIGVYVGNQLFRKEEIKSPVDVLIQSAFIHSSFEVDIQRKLVDIYIEPEFGSYGATSWDDAASIIEIGEKYGQMFFQDFKDLKDSMEHVGWKNNPVEKPVSSDSIYLTEIEINEDQNVQTGFLLNRLGIENNSWITIEDLEDGIDNLYGTRYFTKILYEFRSTGDGKRLIIDAGVAPEGQIKSALQYDLETEISLLLNITYRNLVLNNSRIILEGEISNNPLIDLNYLKYFGDRQRYSLITGFYYRNTGVPLIEDGMTSALYETSYNRYYAGIQRTYRTNRILRIQYAHETALYRPEVISTKNYAIKKLDFQAHNILLRFEDNSLDNRYFPSKGSQHRVKFKYMSPIKLKLEDEPADTLDPVEEDIRAPASISPSSFHQWVIPFNERLNLQLKAAFDFNIHIKESIDSLALKTGILDMNYIGGYRKLMPNFHPFWGSELREYHSEHMFFSELMLQYKVGKQVYFQALGQFYHAYYPFGWIFPAMKESIYGMGGRNYLLGFGASVGYLSPLGPISISIGKDIHSHRMHHFLNLGFYFNRN